MKKVFRHSLWKIGIALFIIFALPLWFIEKGRNIAISSIVSLSSQRFKQTNQQDLLQKEIGKLQLENKLLREEVARACLWAIEAAEFKHRIFTSSSDLKKEDPFFAQKRAKHLYGLLKLREKSLPAKVIFREPGFWSSRVWINIGERENRALDRQIVAKHSPVIWGEELIGIVETVQETRSLVRLITDRELTISVRVVRGKMQYRYLHDKINGVISALTPHEKLKVQKPLLCALQRVKKELSIEEKNTLYLAKGELWGMIEGAKESLWRTPSLCLKGGAFHDEIEIQEGIKKERSSSSSSGVSEKLFLIEPGDLLVTTGIDGVFPPDLVVATVTKVGLQQEIEAIPAASLGFSLSEVLVLPPQ